MKNISIIWNKSYEIIENGNKHDFFIASHKNGVYNGLIFYSIENINRKDPTREPYIFILSEHFFGFSEEEIYNKGIEFLEKTFGNNFIIIEDSTNRFSII